MTKRAKRCAERQANWEELMRGWQQSGQSVRQYCRAAGLRESAFYFWRGELARRNRQPPAGSSSRPQVRPATPEVPRPVQASRRRDPAPAFVPVHLMGRCAEAAYGVEIVLGQGRTVRVGAGFDRQTLADVLTVLGEVPPC